MFVFYLLIQPVEGSWPQVSELKSQSGAGEAESWRKLRTFAGQLVKASKTAGILRTFLQDNDGQKLHTREVANVSRRVDYTVSCFGNRLLKASKKAR